MRDGPRYPMPLHLRDNAEVTIDKISDADTRHHVRQLVARAYAQGFEDGETYGHLTGWKDRKAEEATDEG